MDVTLQQALLILNIMIINIIVSSNHNLNNMKDEPKSQEFNVIFSTDELLQLLHDDKEKGSDSDPPADVDKLLNNGAVHVVNVIDEQLEIMQVSSRYTKRSVALLIAQILT